jgi:hypothetical protein
METAAPDLPLEIDIQIDAKVQLLYPLRHEALLSLDNRQRIVWAPLRTSSWLPFCSCGDGGVWWWCMAVACGGV